jgi:hypothetical protein
MIDYSNKNVCLDGCAPLQILNINGYAFNDISNLKIYDQCGKEYDLSKLEYAYSLDNLCWSCYMNHKEFSTNTADLIQDFYLRLKIRGIIGNITIDGEKWENYSTQLDSSFKFSDTTRSANVYNPYINMDCAISLYQRLTESVSEIVGIECYYFKLAPNTNSRDLTFKEYALMDVSDVKHIKLIINENQMPSSKPEFNEFGLDWQNDWEVEISKVGFATAFGNKIQPTEGDLVYIPMMKRMWMVNGAWEEKKDAFMWNATTFKVALVKYQEKDSVNLGDAEDLVNTFVKNKYEDLFGDEENIGAQFDAANAEAPYNGKLLPVYQSDAVRKSMNLDKISIIEDSTYYKGTLISDLKYKFNMPAKNSKEIEYQRQFCGDSGVISFIINCDVINDFETTILYIGNIRIKLKQSFTKVLLTCPNIKQQLTLLPSKYYFVWLRWDKSLNVSEFGAAEYKWNQKIPLYKLQPAHYHYDIDHPADKKISKWNVELTVNEKSNIFIGGFYGSIANVKIFDIYTDNVSEIMQMYPTSNHLLVNDTCRKPLTSARGGAL